MGIVNFGRSDGEWGEYGNSEIRRFAPPSVFDRVLQIPFERSLDTAKCSYCGSEFKILTAGWFCEKCNAPLDDVIDAWERGAK